MKEQIGDSDMIKLNVFDSNTHEQHFFVFNYADVFTADELAQLKKNPNDLVRLNREAVNKRLRIKEIKVSSGS